ncbi:MAG: S9 family peptidase [Gammaproteobacteria bacterium]|nr:MAG: S9 family peptidase [Gammaproteobacteria bacterium]
MKYPDTKKDFIQESVFGEKIDDPYRWLEDFSSVEALAWVKKQNELTDSLIANNYQKKIKADLEDVWITSDISIPIRRGNKTFYYLDDGIQQQSIFMMKQCDNCQPKILIDPNKFSEDGTVSLSDISVSPNGEYLAYSISDGGSDWRTWKVLEIDTEKTTDDLIEWSKFSYATWESDSSGFYYQKYNKPEEALSDINRSPQLFFHKLGDKQEDDVLIYEDRQNPDYSWSISVPEKGSYRILSIGEGTDERNFLSISLDKDLNFIPLIDEFKATYRFIGGNEDTLWFFSNLDAPNGKILSLKIENLNFKWSEVISEKKFPISGASIAGDKIIINYLVDTISKVEFYDLNGNFLEQLSFEGKGTLAGFSGKLGNEVSYFEFSNFTSPQRIFELDLNTLEYKLYWETIIKGLKVENYESNLNFYKSKDGTDIPIHIAHKKGLEISSETPVLLYGYGGFNISILPYFSKTFYMWIKSGGVLAVANLRGGGEYGDSWHKSGMLLNKQNVFDDFAFAAKHLHSEGIGSPDTTASLGRSNGGLLVAATMLQYPDLFKVAIPQVGVLDMLRFHKFTIGWAWESDYGEPEKQEDFLNLLSYSPYHNIEKDVCYPTTLITTSSRDDRVVPSHSYKFAARLQELQGCSNPILLRVESRAGHGAGTSKDKQIDEIADIFGYALNVIKEK